MSRQLIQTDDNRRIGTWEKQGARMWRGERNRNVQKVQHSPGFSALGCSKVSLIATPVRTTPERSRNGGALGRTRAFFGSTFARSSAGFAFAR